MACYIQTSIYVIRTFAIERKTYIYVIRTQRVKSTFNALINEDYSIAIDIKRYQRVLEHALSKIAY